LVEEFSCAAAGAGIGREKQRGVRHGADRAEFDRENIHSVLSNKHSVIVQMPRQSFSDATYFEKLQDYYAQHRVFPSYAAIGRLIGLKSTSSVSAFLDRLKAERYVETKDRRLKPGPRFFERPLMQSHISAGLPSVAYDGPPEGLAIDAHLVNRPSRTFLMTVKGDSMIDAGLMPGDVAIVERGNAAAEGDIVVAVVDDGYTVKRLVRENRKYVLKPENKAYPILRPDPLEIVGVIVGSFRKYK
jgi:SOS regulatory protein LexA